MHNIQERDIQTGVEMAWHNLTKIQNPITRKNCGIIYPMVKQQLLLPDQTPTDFFSVVSLDDGKPIGVPITKGYALITNEQIWEMIETALGSTKHEIVSVGTIGNRAIGFVSVKLDKDTAVIAGRETKNVLNVLWGHGGVMSVKAKTGLTVVVCQNTFNMALKENSDFSFNVKHTPNALPKLAGMSEAIDAHYTAVAEFNTGMTILKGISCKATEAQKIFAGFLIRGDVAKLEKISTRTKNQIETLTTLFSLGKGNSGADYADVFNATTDYFTHNSSGGEKVWKQIESSEFGMGNTRKNEMFALLRGETVAKLGSIADVIKRGKIVLDMV